MNADGNRIRRKGAKTPKGFGNRDLNRLKPGHRTIGRALSTIEELMVAMGKSSSQSARFWRGDGVRGPAGPFGIEGSCGEAFGARSKNAEKYWARFFISSRLHGLVRYVSLPRS